MAYDNQFIKTLSDFVGGVESNGDYNIAYGQTAADQDFTNMSVRQVRNWQDNYVNSGSPSSAVGKYQIIGPTMDGLINNMGLTGDEQFTPELQDQMFVELANGRGLRDFQSGKLSQEEFMNNLAKEWAAIPTSSGQSFYAGDGLNKANTTVDQTLSVLRGNNGLTADTFSTSLPERAANVVNTAMPAELGYADFNSLSATKSSQLEAAASTKLQSEGSALSQLTGYQQESPLENFLLGANQLNNNSLPPGMREQLYADLNSTWMKWYEEGTVTGEGKNLAAAFTSGTIRISGDILKLPMNIIVNTARLKNNPQMLDAVDWMLPVLDSIGASQEYWASNVNRAGEENLKEAMREYTDSAARSLENGDYFGVVKNMFSGVFVGASEDPVGALTLFTESLPQMMATAYSMGGNFGVIQQDRQRTLYDEFVTENGVPPTGEQQAIIVAMSALSAFADVGSDKLFMKGAPLITNNMAKLAGLVGIPQKSVLRTAGSIIGSVSGQVGQEMISGGTTEFADQYAVGQSLSKLNVNEIALQAGIEGVAVAPVQAGRAAVGTVRTVAAPLTTALAERALKAQQTGQSTVGSVKTMGDHLRQTIQEFNNVDMGNGTTFGDTSPLFRLESIMAEENLGQVAQEAAAQGLENTGTYEYLKGLQSEVKQYLVEAQRSEAEIARAIELFQKIESIGVAEGTVKPRVNTETRNSSVETLINSTEATPEVTQAKDSILYSMRSSTDFDIQVVQDLLNTGFFNEAETKEANDYIALKKTFDEVGQEVAQGQDEKYRGYINRINDIRKATADGDTATAQSERTLFDNNLAYQKLKIKAFADANAFRTALNAGKNVEPPASLTDVETTKTKKGYKVNFRVANDMNFAPEDTFFVQNADQIRQLVKTIKSEVEAMERAVQALDKNLLPVESTATSTSEDAVKVEEEESTTIELEQVTPVSSAPAVPRTPKKPSLDTGTPEVEIDYTSTINSPHVTNVINDTQSVDKAGRKLSDFVIPKKSQEDSVIETEDEVDESTTTYEPSSRMPVLSQMAQFLNQMITSASTVVKVNEAQKEHLRTLYKVQTQFTKRLYDQAFMKAKWTENPNIPFYETSPQNFLFNINSDPNTRNTIDENLITALSVAAVNWLGSEGGATLLNDKATINKMRGVSSRAPLDNIAAEMLKDGVQENLIAPTIGRQVLDAMGMKINPNLSAQEEANFITGIGGLVLALMDDLNMVNTMYVSPKVMGKDLEAGPLTKRDIVDRSIPRKGYTKLIIANNSNTVVETILKDYNQGNKNERLKDVLSQVFGVATAVKLPTFAPKEKTAKATYLRSDRKLPMSVINTINKAQAVPFKFKPQMEMLLENARDRNSANRTLLRKVLGYRFTSKWAEVPASQKAIEVAKNDLIEREIDQLLDFYEIYKNEGKASFFFEYNAWSNGRNGIASQDFNPQANKLIRHFIQMDSWTKDVTLSNQDQVSAFQYSVMLGLGFKTDQITPRNMDVKFKEILKDKRTEVAIAAIRTLKTDPSNVKALSNLAAVVEAFKEKSHTLDSLVSLEEYVTAVEAGNTKFTTNLANETDAKTSGVILGLLLGGFNSPEEINKLAAGGVFTDGTSSYADWKKTGKLDNYEQLSTQIAEEMTKILEDLVTNPEEFPQGAKQVRIYNEVLSQITTTEGEAEVKGLIGKIARDIAKDPVMISNYGAGLNAIVRNFVELQIRSIERKLAGDSKAIYIRKLNETMDNKLLPNFDITVDTLPPAFENELRAAIRNTYGLAMNEALQKFNPNFTAYQQGINKGINMMSWYFTGEFNKAVAAKAEKLGLDPSRLPKTVVNEILRSNAMMTFRPMIAMMDSSNRSKGIEVIKSVKNYDLEDKSTAVNVAYSRRGPDNSFVSAQRKINAYKRVYAEPGVSGFVKAIQYTDSFLARGMLNQGDVFHIFDGFYADVDNTANVGEAYSKKAIEATKNFSMANAVLEPLKQMIEESTLTTKELAAIVRAGSGLTILKDEMETNTDFKTALKGIVTGLEQWVEFEKTNKETLFNRITNVDHAPGFNTTSVINKPPTELGDDVLQSAGDADIAGFVADSEHDLTSDNIMNVYQRLLNVGNVRASAEHSNYLLEVLDGHIRPLLKKFGPHKLAIGSSAQKSIGWLNNKTVNINAAKGRLMSNLDMSSIEILSHEVYHAVTKAGIADPSNASIIRDLVRLQRETKAALNQKHNGEGWREFLKTDANGNIMYQISEEMEIKAAKEQFDYIFNQDTFSKVSYVNADGNVVQTKVRTALLEFVAYGLSNEKLSNTLKTLKFTRNKVEITEGASIWRRLETLFLSLVDKLSRRMSRTRDITGQKALMEMMDEINRAHQTATFSTRRAMQSIEQANDTVRKAWVNSALIPLGKMNYRIFAKLAGSRNLLANVTSLGLGTLGTMMPLKGIPNVDESIYTAGWEKARKTMNFHKRGLVHSIFNMVVPSDTPIMREWERYQLISKQMVDTARERAIESNQYVARSAFRTDMDQQDWEALTLGVLQTDLVTLFDKFSNKEALEVANLLKDPKALKAEIDKLQNQLISRFGTTGNFYVNQSMSLGRMMVTNKAAAYMQGYNAHVIANGTMLDDFIKNAENSSAEPVIDRLATLAAIDTLTADTRNRTAAILEREYGENQNANGFKNYLAMHRAFKADSLVTNFDNNPILMSKGFIKQTFDPHVEIRIGTLEEQNIMLKDGFVLVSTLDKDYSDQSPDKVMYINSHAGLGRYNKTIVSMTNPQVAGSSIRNGRVADDTLSYTQNVQEINKIKAAHKKEIRKQFNSPNALDFDSEIMIPSVNTTGQVHDFRYQMHSSLRKSVMGMRLDGSEVLARMIGGIIDKDQTKVVNQEVVKRIKEDFDKSYLSNPKDFVELSLDSSYKDAVDIYKLIPEDMRLRFKAAFGETPIMVRAEALDIIFGFRKLSLSKRQRLVIFRIIEDLWKEIVQFGKINIVVKNPVVNIANTLSNIAMGVLRGVPVEDMGKGMLRGIKLLNNYQADNARLNKLEVQLRAAQAAGDSVTELRSEIAEVKDLINRSELKSLLDAGLFQTVVEDIDTANINEEGYIEKFGKLAQVKLPGFLTRDSVADKAKSATDFGLITQDTAAFRLLLKATQYSDFVSRFAVYDYKVNKAPKNSRWNHQQALDNVVDMYINYEIPVNKWLQYADDMGALIFLKYPLRIVRVLYQAFKENPLNLIGLAILESSISPIDPDSPLDGNVHLPSSSFGMLNSAVTTLPINNFIPNI